MSRLYLLFALAIALCVETPVVGQDGPASPTGWTPPDTVRLQGAGAFTHPELIPGEDVLYVAAHTVYHPQLVGKPSLVENSDRYRTSKSVWLGRVEDPGFEKVSSLPFPPGDFLYLYPEGEANLGGTLHLAWAEAHPDSIVQRRSTVDRARAKRVYYARYEGPSWSPPSVVYRSKRENPSKWEDPTSVVWRSDQEGAFKLGPDGTPHFVIDHTWGSKMVYVRRRKAGSWSADTIRYENGSRPLGWAPDLVVGQGGRLVFAYSSGRIADSLQSNEVRVARSADGGDTRKRSTVLVPEQRIRNEKGNGSVRHLQLVGRPSDTLHVVWGRKTSRNTFSAQELWHAWSADGGATWTTTSPIDLPENGHLDDLEVLAGPDGTSHVFVHLGGLKGNDASTSDLLYTRWRPGEGWAELEALSPASKHVHGAAFAVWRGRLQVIWSQMPLPFEYTSSVTILRRSRPLLTEPAPE